MKSNAQQKAFVPGTVGMQKAEVSLCRFEQVVERLGLTPNEYETSAELKAWCEANKDTYYVPTVLLTAWHMATIYDEGAKPSKLDLVQAPTQETIPAEASTIQ